MKSRTKKYPTGYAKKQRVTGPPVGPVIAPAIISRVPVFQPRFKNLVETTVQAETAWGSVEVRGRIGGIHRKVLDALFAAAVEEPYRHDTGALSILIDPYRTAKTAGVAMRHPQWLRGILEDMRVARVLIEDKTTGLRHWAGIVSEVTESTRKAAMPGGVLRGERDLWVVTISSAWMRIYDTSLVLRYRLMLPPLGRITSGAAHAVALHVITHTGDHSYSVEDTLHLVGAVTPETSDRHRRRLIQEVAGEEEHLGALGMTLYHQSGTGKLMISYHPTGAAHVQLPAGELLTADAICAGPDAICAGPDAICAGPDAICAGSQY